MAKPTEQQVRALEAALLEQFHLLVQGVTFREALAKKYGRQAQPTVNYNAYLMGVMAKWVQREGKYEVELVKQGHKGGLIVSGNLKVSDFTNPDRLGYLWELDNRFNKEKQVNSLGYIPILIWAVVAIVLSISATVVTDDLTTTTQEKESLMRTTQETCKSLNLTTEQCAAMISQTQKEVSSSSGMGDLLKIAIPLLIGVGIYNAVTD